MSADRQHVSKLDVQNDSKMNLKSVMADQNSESRCLVKFHNCTNKNIHIYWIDFSGNPVKYPLLRQRQSITIDTYVSHLWFFKIESTEEDQLGIRQMKKVLAIPQEALGPNCNATTCNYRATRDDDNRAERLWLCPMCRYVLTVYSRRPVKNLCHHYSGEAKLSSSDLEAKSYPDFSVGDLIYLCSETTHREYHSRKRRSIFLVESFYNLRERCFIQMTNKIPIPRPQVSGSGMPLSVLRDYVQFVDAFDKCRTV